MFERFRSQFLLLPEGQEPAVPWMVTRLAGIAGYEELMVLAAGCSFENGLYRVHSAVTGSVGQTNADAAFPEHAGRLSVFGLIGWAGSSRWTSGGSRVANRWS